jgi:hypothetical protein
MKLVPLFNEENKSSNLISSADLFGAVETIKKVLFSSSLVSPIDLSTSVEILKISLSFWEREQRMNEDDHPTPVIWMNR